MHQEILMALVKQRHVYIVLETKYTAHHLERLMPTARDRGCWKWIAESKTEMWENQDREEEARLSHVDHADMFPRFYFLDASLVNELFAWLSVRGLKPTLIEARKV